MITRLLRDSCFLFGMLITLDKMGVLIDINAVLGVLLLTFAIFPLAAPEK